MLLKKILFLCLLLTSTSAGAQQDIVSFRVSKPYCLLNFMNSCIRGYNVSQGLVMFIEQKGLLKDTAFSRLVEEYRSIPIEYHYNRDQFPSQRMRSRYGSIADLLVIAAVQSDGLEDFRKKTIGLLPNSDHARLFRVFEDVMPYYDRLVWIPEQQSLATQLDTLHTYQGRISTLFSKLNHFYSSSWTPEMPFTVALYPVPGRRVPTGATPHINTLCVGVRSGDTDYDGIAGVVLHEMCHSLYNEQSAVVQLALDKLFIQDTSRFRSFAYNYFDEGLATACGNGWAFETFHGKPDKGEWYNDPYIDGFGHGLYPLVKDYLGKGKTLDSAFVAHAIDVFAQLFPKAPYDYGLLLSNINLYSDAEDAAERGEIQTAIRKHFRIASYSSSTPILNSTSLDMLENTTTTQVVIVHKNGQKNLQKLQTMFPPLHAALRGKRPENFVCSFFDEAERPVVIIHVDKLGSVEKVIKQLAQLKYIDPNKPYHAL